MCDLITLSHSPQQGSGCYCTQLIASVLSASCLLHSDQALIKAGFRRWHLGLCGQNNAFWWNGHINVMIPLRLQQTSTSSFCFPTISVIHPVIHADVRATSLVPSPPPVAAARLIVIIFSHLQTLALAARDTHKYPLTFIECQRPLGGWLILTPFQWCQSVICCHIMAVLKSYFLHQWKY